MATPKKMIAPPHCQLRSAVTGLKCLKDNMMRSLAAIQTYASEGYREQAVGESKHVRQLLEGQSRELIQNLEDLINELKMQHRKNLELKSNCEQLKKKIQCFENEDMYFSQACATEDSKLSQDKDNTKAWHGVFCDEKDNVI